MNFHIRDYHTDDLPAVLNLFRKNVPAYFAPEEEADFVTYLNREREAYFIVETTEGEVGACGGINWLRNGSEGRLSWDMVNPLLHGKGMGTALVNFRLKRILEQPSVEEIIVRTSQLTVGFYERCGFTLQQTIVDYWAPGYHLCLMKYSQ